MSAQSAFVVLTWAAIVVLFLAVAALLREVRLLRAFVARTSDGYSAAPPLIRFDSEQLANGREQIVVAADSGCPLCGEVVSELAHRSTEEGAAVVLTYEPSSAWPDELLGGLRLVTDRDAWRAVGHLTPPVLMKVDGSGTVQQLVLPMSAGDALQRIDGWLAPRQAARADVPERPGRPGPAEKEMSGASSPGTDPGA
jgi:hypothetical protein